MLAAAFSAVVLVTGQLYVEHRTTREMRVTQQASVKEGVDAPRQRGHNTGDSRARITGPPSNDLARSALPSSVSASREAPFTGKRCSGVSFSQPK